MLIKFVTTAGEALGPADSYHVPQIGSVVCLEYADVFSKELTTRQFSVMGVKWLVGSEPDTHVVTLSEHRLPVANITASG